MNASSTIGNGNQDGGLTVYGGATTTGNLVVQGNGTSTFAGGLSASVIDTVILTSTFGGIVQAPTFDAISTTATSHSKRHRAFLVDVSTTTEIVLVVQVLPLIVFVGISFLILRLAFSLIWEPTILL